jgi:PHD/YefM family antitoxin component YafN of YafNO toxin-antitoxin module
VAEKVTVFESSDAPLELFRDKVILGKSPLAIVSNSGSKQIIVPVEDYRAGGVFK